MVLSHVKCDFSAASDIPTNGPQIMVSSVTCSLDL